MAAPKFDPDAYLATAPAFDPDAYLAKKPDDGITPFQRNVRDVASGLVRGAGSIGATFIRPFETAEENQQRRTAMDAGLANLVGADPNSFAYGLGKVGGEIAGTAGVGPGLAGAIKGIPYLSAFAPSLQASGMAGNIGQRVLAGGIVGGATALQVDPSQVQQGATAGAIASAALPPVMRGLGAVGDFATQKAKLKAAEIVRKSLKNELPAAQAAFQSAPADITAGQAIANLNAPTAQALFARALELAPEEKLAIANAQEAARMSGLAQVTPDLKTVTDARKAITDPLYAAARSAQGVDATPALAFIDDVLAKNPGNRELVTEFSQLRSGLIDPATKALRTDAQQVTSVLDGIKASLGRKENKFIVDRLLKAKTLIADAIPGYSGAQQQFAALSQPVNQSQILGRMQDVLAKPTGGERVTPFLNVLGTGEDALIKSATGAPRYKVGDLNKVLAPNQMQQVDKVAGELKRDAAIAGQASEGQRALAQLFSENISKFRLPQWMSFKATIANKGLEEIELKLGKDIMKELAKAVQSGKSMDELLSTLPLAQRNKVWRVLTDAEAQGFLTRPAALGSMNMLANPQESQNELAR